jgi:hypothetical protein
MAPVASEKGTASHPRHMLQHVTPPNPERGSVTHKHTPLIRGVRYVTPPPVKSRRRRLNPFYAPSDACAYSPTRALLFCVQRPSPTTRLVS